MAVFVLTQLEESGNGEITVFTDLFEKFDDAVLQLKKTYDSLVRDYGETVRDDRPENFIDYKDMRACYYYDNEYDDWHKLTIRKQQIKKIWEETA